MKTAKKLEAICTTYGITFAADKDSCGDWNILFYAPDMKAWVSSTCTTISYRSSSLKDLIPYLKEELSEGFYDLNPNDKCDMQVLLETGQI